MLHLILHALPINTQGTVSIVGHWYVGVAKALASHVFFYSYFKSSYSKMNWQIDQKMSIVKSSILSDVCYFTFLMPSISTKSSHNYKTSLLYINIEYKLYKSEHNYCTEWRCTEVQNPCYILNCYPAWHECMFRINNTPEFRAFRTRYCWTSLA